MELIIEYAIMFALGWWIGSKVTGTFQLMMFKQILTDLNISNKDLIRVARKTGADFITPEQEATLKAAEEAEEADLERIEIKVEKHSETLYAFRKDNDAFLGQGSTREQLIEAMGQRMKNVRLIVVEGNEYMKTEA